jgi:hypothetical protein
MSEPTKDHLSERERATYKVLHTIGLIWGASGFLAFFVFGQLDPTLSHVLVFAAGCTLVPVFGLALRNDIRVIHGVRWLRGK